jgi:hypothetical protein
MKGKRAKTAVLICALCAAGVVAAAERAESETASQQEPCCFENPRFSGTCEVVPGPEETCGDILAYLNNPNGVGKDYCGNTTIRGGWTQVACDDSTSTDTAATCREGRK